MAPLPAEALRPLVEIHLINHLLTVPCQLLRERKTLINSGGIFAPSALTAGYNVRIHSRRESNRGRRMENKVDTFKAPADGSSVKTYHRPQLITYGNLCEVTLNVGTVGKNDSSPPQKTGF